MSPGLGTLASPQEENDIYVIAKTYPHPSRSYVELVCTAGIMQGQLVRLYPIPFRYLERDQMFPKYSWIRAALHRRARHKDARPDSYVPDQTTIRVIEKPASAPDWDKRRDLILPLVSSSMEDVQARYDGTKQSLGIFKPAEVELSVEKVSPDWSPRQLQALKQSRLWIGKPKPLEKIPYAFRYSYRCNRRDCKGHEQLITDWELGAAYLRWREAYGPSEVERKIREKWVDWMWGERDSYLIVGRTHRYATFIVIGVFYPPRGRLRQTSLRFQSG